MKRWAGLFIVLATVAAACGGSTATTITTTTTAPSPEPVSLAATPGLNRADPAADAPVAEVVAGLNDAGFALLRTHGAAENLVLSPASVGHALLMARGAADDVTAAAIDEALQLPPGDDADRGWNAIDFAMARSAEDEDQVTLTIADRIWPRTDVQPNQAWIDGLTAHHGVTIETLDFAGDPDGSRDIINEWISDETEELIPELLPQDFVTPATVLVLTDAVYFKAQWQTEFGKYQPTAGAFTRLDGTTVDVEFMRELELGGPRGAGDGFVAAEIPYIGGDFSMLLIVPEFGRFEDIRSRLDQATLDDIDGTLVTGPYELLMPKWTTTTALDLLPWLSNIGAEPGAYPGIAPEAFLGAAVHGADIAVDEQGTVAAAATAFAFLESGPPEPELTVAADRPFLYLIRHSETGLVLFVGQVTDPTQ